MDKAIEVPVSLATISVSPVIEIGFNKMKAEIVGKVEEKVEETVKAATTGLSESTVELVMEGVLTEKQKKILTLVYETAKNSVESIIKDHSLDNSLRVTLTIANVIKVLEKVKVDSQSPSGSDKKAIALELGRRLLKDFIPEEAEKQTILALYDLLAESTLETMIDISKSVNGAAVKEVAIKCCAGFFA